MNISDMRPGILPRHYLEELRDKVLFNASKIKASSLDLHLAQDIWEMKGSLRLRPDLTFSQVSDDPAFVLDSCRLSKGKTLKPKTTYIIKLKEHFRNNHGYELYGQATGKSTIGRLDVLTRLIVDGSPHYDILPKDYNGPLYVEVTPISFPVVVKEGLALNQLRLFRGEDNMSRIGGTQIPLYPRLTDSTGDPEELHLDLSAVAKCDKEVIAFTTKSDVFAEDSDKIDLSKLGTINPWHYWEFVQPNEQPYIEIKRDRFYILRSKERFYLPSDVGVYCQAITENLGEIRIHYAGFVHPGFGLYRIDKNGAPLMFEVRGHTVDAFLNDGELLAKIMFFRTSSEVEFSDKEIEKMRKDAYNNQELQLSKYFKPWETSE